MFAWLEREARVTRAFTDRLGGVSRPPYDELNLGLHVGDREEDVRANRALVEQEFGAPMVVMNQVHASTVAIVDSPDTPPVDADAMVSTRSGLALAVLVADCVPVLFDDAQRGVIGAAHAGRPGMAAGVVPATLAAMRDLGARTIRATIGPSVCARCYEVPEQMRDDVAATEPLAASVTWQGTPSVDVAAGVAAQLAREGVSVQWCPGCTRESAGSYSYRRDGVTGRTAGLIALNGAAA